MGVQLSLKAALPLAGILATASDRCRKTGPWTTLPPATGRRSGGTQGQRWWVGTIALDPCLIWEYWIQHGANGPLYVSGPSLRILDSTRCQRTPLCHILLLNLDILQGGFRLCNWLSLRRLVSWINHLPPACWSTFWKSNSKQQLGCRFDIMDYESYFFVFWHMQLYMSWYIRSFFGFTFLNILYFFKYSCTNIFL